MISRNSKLLTKYNLNQYFLHNEVLQCIFSETDPNIIAETLLNELSIIIKCIAPSKKIQCVKTYAPWIKDEFLFLITSDSTSLNPHPKIQFVFVFFVIF